MSDEGAEIETPLSWLLPKGSRPRPRELGVAAGRHSLSALARCASEVSERRGCRESTGACLPLLLARHAEEFTIMSDVAVSEPCLQAPVLACSDVVVFLPGRNHDVYIASGCVPSARL